MTSQTVLLDFTIDDTLDINLCEEIIKNFCDEKLSSASCSGLLKLEFRHTGVKLKTIYDFVIILIGANVNTANYSGPGDLFVVIRVHHSSRLVTINIDGERLCITGSQFKDGCLDTSSVLWSSQTDLGNFVSSLARKLGTDKYNSLPSVTRGLELSPYWTTTGVIGNFLH